MDLTNTRHDVYPGVGVLYDEQYLSGIIHSDRDSYHLRSPAVMYNPYASEIDHLDKTIFLEHRMRIQQNIINKHKTEAERSLTRDKNGHLLSKHSSMNDLKGKKSYSDMFNKQINKANRSDENKSNSDLERLLIPKDNPVNIHSNVLDFRSSESLDTARGRAKYALVRLNGGGETTIPLYVESVHPLVIPGINPHVVDQPLYNRQVVDPTLKAIDPHIQTVCNPHGNSNMAKSNIIDPNNFIGPKNRAVLEKVNGSDESNGDSQNLERNERNGKKLNKKSSKISLDDLNLPNDTKHPLLSRKSKQAIKTLNKANEDMPTIGNLELGRNPEPIMKRRMSHETNQSNKNSSITSRQSSNSKGSAIETPLSFTSSKGTTSPVSKRGRFRHSEKPNNINNDVNRQTNMSPRLSDKQKLGHSTKKREPRPPNSSQILNESVSDTKVKITKQVKSEETIKSHQQQNMAEETKNHPDWRHSKTVDKKHNQKENAQKTEKRHDRTENFKMSDKHDSIKHHKSKVNDQKRTYVGKNKRLRKTDSFKMVGNSSHFFGYCSVPEDGGKTMQSPKSILKKPKRKPDRPDTA